MDVGQGRRERLHDPVGLAGSGQRLDELAKIAHGEREPGLELVAGARHALGELPEEDPEQLVDEDRDVALERESAIALASLVGEEGGEGVDAVMR